MDGIVESAHCADSIVASCSVACVVALLSSLEDLSLGRGLSDEHIEFLSKMKEDDKWEELYQSKVKYANAASARDVPKFTVADVTFEGEDQFAQAKGSPEGDINSVTERFERNGQGWGARENGKEKKGKNPNACLLLVIIRNKVVRFYTPFLGKALHFQITRG